MKKAEENFTVVRDTREKEGHGWTFGAGGQCDGTVVETLWPGDYSLRGYEDVLRVERKGSISEFAQNVTQKEKWACFKRELEALDAFPASFLVLEFSRDDVVGYPDSAGLPWAIRSKIKMGGAFLVKRVLEIELHFKTKVVFVGRVHGREWATSLFKRVVERWKRHSPPG